MGEQVVHFEVNAKSGKRARKFYGSLFDWKINADNPMDYGLVNTGGKGVQGGIGQVDAGKPSYVTFYIGVDDPQKYLDRAVSLGGKVVLPLTRIPNMVTFAQFADPEGNVVGLVKNEMPRPASATKSSAKKSSPKKKKRA